MTPGSAPETIAFSARLLVDGTRADGGPPLTRLTGRHAITGGLVVTAVTL